MRLGTLLLIAALGYGGWYLLTQMEEGGDRTGTLTNEDGSITKHWRVIQASGDEGFAMRYEGQTSDNGQSWTTAGTATTPRGAKLLAFEAIALMPGFA